MKEYCNSCKHDDDIGFCDKCMYNHILEERGIPPTEYEAYEKPTNADRIRAMSDEELAEMLTTVARTSAEMLCKSIKTVDVDLSPCDFEPLYKSHLKWLKRAAEEVE